MQISGKRLTEHIEKEIFKKLYQALADLRKPEDVQEFLNDALSLTERTAIAKRLAIVLYLQKGKSYDAIKQDIKVSSATIASVQKDMETGGNGFALALERIEADEWASDWAKKIAAFFKNFSLKKSQLPV